MADPNDLERQRLMDAYHKATAAEQAVVKLLAVNWAALGKSQLNAVMRKVLGASALKALDIDRLLKASLLQSIKDWSGQQLKCSPLIIELVTRELVLEGHFNHFVDLVRVAAPLQKGFMHENRDDFIFRNNDEVIREVRLGMYWRDESYIASLFRMLDKHRYYFTDAAPPLHGPSPVYAMVCSNPFDLEWFSGLPQGIRQKALPGTLALLLKEWRSDSQAFGLLQEGCQAADAPRDWMNAMVLLLIYRGEWQAAEAMLQSGASVSVNLGIHGLQEFLSGDMDMAVKLFRESLSQLRRDQGNKKAFFSGPLGLLFVLCLQLRNAAKDMEDSQKLAACVDEGDAFALAYKILGFVPYLERNELGLLEPLKQLLDQGLAKDGLSPWNLWVAALVLFRYQGGKALLRMMEAMESARQTALASGFGWLAAEMAGLIAAADPARADAAEQAAGFEAQAGHKLLLNRIQREEPWERALKAISNTVAPRPKETREKTATETRLAWFVFPSTYLGTGYGIELREQARNARGAWNKGKAVSFKRLRESAGQLPGMLEQDVRIASHVIQDRYSNAYHLGEKGWLALVGHPNVFLRDSGTPLELAAAEPELRVKKSPDGSQVRIEFWPKFQSDQKIVIAKDGLTRLQIIELKPEHHRLADIIGEGLDAPLAAQERILASLSSVSSLVTIHSDIGGAEVVAAETVESDPRPRLQLIPEGEGLRIALLVRPFGEQGGYFAPGSGGAGLIAEIGGKRLQTQRDLKQERQLADEILSLCPSLGGKAEEIQDWQWLAPDPEASLECLLELHDVGEKALVEWPQGEKFKLMGQAGLGRFSLKLQQQRDWFSVSGELKLDNGEVVNMQRLLELTAGSRSKFIRLDENRFLALTDAFRKRLDDLRAYSEKHGKDQRLNLLALPAFEEIAEEVGEFQADAAWRKHIERLREAERFTPKLPSTLQAELRDYQLEGFEWLSRLAAWGVGACLADDMGLGKTLQAIALVLTRAGEGPTLVVAPTSVCFNWQNEVGRFAPTLNIRFMGAGADRQQLIDSLKPWDLLICSYGLLQQESVGEMLAQVKFRTIVLDEAQAIKNAATKRSQQAMALQGDFKLITTGTPVENHLGELWNLMRFVNPGLLGSAESFNRRFAGPIERNQDREAKHRLKRLIQPFILRRTKAQVLNELPSRTEIELSVELGEKEAVFYEALRRKLMEELTVTGSSAEDQRFKVLAAITKLRRACCNPSLVAPDLGLASSKLELFSEVLDELLDNRHKALVFSQFVDHLSIIRAHLDAKGIAYQYLDGQTPAGERKKRVEAFQAGAGDVFLISLKAGGVGLNLTAADYVIHMDPWWNPAVEDQASDRAHRIGQQRPVTVYRLVTKGTIEEQIVSLHRQKRDLADSLLEGGEISGKVGAEELLQLMRGE